MITMDWIKKNWMVIAIGALILAVIIYFIRQKKNKGKITVVLPKIPGLSSRGLAPTAESKAAMKKQLEECEKGSAMIRLAPGSVHPCAALRDLVAESGYFVQQSESAYGGSGIDPFTETKNGLNTMDFAMGMSGTSLLEDGNMHAESNFIVTGCPPGKEPNPTTGKCGDVYSWDQMPENNFGKTKPRPSSSGSIKTTPGGTTITN